MSELAQAYEDFRRRGGVVDLADRVKLLFTGKDRVRYINGQVTANIAAAKMPSVTPACVTTAKGKLTGDVFVSLGPSGILIDADASLAETLPPRLERYIIADDVQLEDVTESVAIIHLLGMSEPPECIRQNALPSTRFGVPGWDYFPPFRKDMEPIWTELSAQLPILSSEVLELVRIEHGVPKWGTELDADVLPPEAGLDRTHIDFHKGCYIGQEVISRIKSVGRVNRELRGFVLEKGVELRAGDRIFSEADSEKEIGHLTSVAFSFALDRPIALGYLRRGAPESCLVAKADQGAPATPIQLHSLPFVP